MALADVEGAQIYLKDLTIAHHMASWESIQEILIRHYNRQLLHETYKVELIYISKLLLVSKNILARIVKDDCPISSNSCQLIYLEFCNLFILSTDMLSLTQCLS